MKIRTLTNDVGSPAKRWVGSVDPAFDTAHTTAHTAARDDAMHIHIHMDALIDKAFLRALELGVQLESLWLCHDVGTTERRLMASYEGPPGNIGCTIPRKTDVVLARVWLDDSELVAKQCFTIRAEGVGL